MEKMVGTRINPIQAVGLMSGTSLDGIDLAYVHFWEEDGWKFNLQHTHYIPYSNQEKKELRHLMEVPAAELLSAHARWGHRFGQEIRSWLNNIQQTPHLIASHGHTIFHQPEKGFTFQLGVATLCNEKLVYQWCTISEVPMLRLEDKELRWSHSVSFTCFPNTTIS